MNSPLLVLCNTPDIACANTIARHLVEHRLAACVSILPMCRSLYTWQGRLEEANEIPLQIKTTTERYAELEQTLRRLHPYELPEIIALPISAGLPAYLNWMTHETAPP